VIQFQSGAPHSGHLTGEMAPIEDEEQRSLAEYIVRRKVVLDFMEILLGTRHLNKHFKPLDKKPLDTISDRDIKSCLDKLADTPSE
jgi:hypothetical protein